MRNRSSKPTLLLVAFFLVPFFCSTVLSTISLADEPGKSDEWLFVTKDGARVVGTLTNADQEPRTKYLIKTPDGQEVTIRADELRNQRRAKDNEVEYAKRRATVADTVESQWALAQWCRSNHFLSNRKTHLKRILELSPDHKEARVALGYSQVDGRWMTQNEIQESRGYRRYKGHWRTEQQIVTLKKAEKLEKAEKRWYATIKRYVGWLGSAKTDKAMLAFSEITDPAAVRALGRFLASDQPFAVKIVFIHTLAHISEANPEDRTAHRPLAICTMEDPNEEIRLSCLDFLKKTKDPNMVDYFTGHLNVKRATRKYKKDANMMINRAALALGELGDPSAVGPLIKVLITEHKEKITSGSADQTSATFGNKGGGLSMGQSTKIVVRHISNEDVLTALKKLTGVSFNFDVPTWQAWYDHQTRQAIPDTRRGK